MEAPVVETDTTEAVRLGERTQTSYAATGPTFLRIELNLEAQMRLEFQILSTKGWCFYRVPSRSKDRNEHTAATATVTPHISDAFELSETRHIK